MAAAKKAEATAATAVARDEPDTTEAKPAKKATPVKQTAPKVRAGGHVLTGDGWVPEDE
jgi:hypothetical protein